MPPVFPALSEKSRLAVLLEHFSAIDDPRDVRRISHPLAEVLLLVEAVWKQASRRSARDCAGSAEGGRAWCRACQARMASTNGPTPRIAITRFML